MAGLTYLGPVMSLAVDYIYFQLPLGSMQIFGAAVIFCFGALAPLLHYKEKFASQTMVLARDGMD